MTGCILNFAQLEERMDREGGHDSKMVSLLAALEPASREMESRYRWTQVDRNILGRRKELSSIRERACQWIGQHGR